MPKISAPKKGLFTPPVSGEKGKRNEEGGRGMQQRQIDFNCSLSLLSTRENGGGTIPKAKLGCLLMPLGETLSAKHVQAGRHVILEVLQI